MYGDLIAQLRQNAPGSVSTTGQRIEHRNSSEETNIDCLYREVSILKVWHLYVIAASSYRESEGGAGDDSLGGRVSPVLLSHRAPLHAAAVRGRLQGASGGVPGGPPLPAAPAAPLVPVLAQEEAVLDLSSVQRPDQTAPSCYPLNISPGDFPGLGSEVQLRRVPPPSEATVSARKRQRQSSPQDFSIASQRNPLTSVMDRGTSR